MITLLRRLLFLIVVMQSFTSVYAAATSANSAADDLSAKAFLEDLMVRRYSQGLSTIIDRQAFSLGVEMQLVDAPKAPPKPLEKPSVEIDTPTDLVVGTLDPEKLIQQFGLSDEKPAIVSLLATKRIKFVQVSVGLREDLGASVKTDVEKWLSTRLSNEFGKSGKGEVTFVKEIPPKPEKSADQTQKKWWDWLSQFQQLAGELLMALTILLGIILWRFTTAKASVSRNNSGESPNIKLQAEGQGLGGGGGAGGEFSTKGAGSAEEVFAEQRRATEEVMALSQKLTALVPKMTGEFESIVRSWCQAGDEGKMKLVCFAEAVGRDVGRLPIPVDATKDVAKIFARMAEVGPKEKAQMLEKAYWDLVSVLNLGSQVLSQPFGYLSGIDTGVINQVLMDQNPKMKTLVSLFLPDEVRRKFVKPMSPEQKFQLLENAAKMSEIASEELHMMDSAVMKKVKSGGSSSDAVQLDMTLEKIISSLSILEEIEMLSKLQGPGVQAYRRKYPSLAFLKEWPDDKLSVVMARLRTDQAVAYLRIEPGMSERMIALAPPMTAEMITDELSQPDKSTAEDKIRTLEVFAELLRDLVGKKELDLTDIFEESKAANENNVIGIKSA